MTKLQDKLSATVDETADMLAPGTWTLVPAESRVGFTVMSLPPARGSFDDVQGTLTVAGDGTIAASGTVATASLRTGNPVRDWHLRTAHFLHVARHPTIFFETYSVTRVGRRLRLHTDLTIKGITRPVALVGRLEPSERDPGVVRLSLSGELDRRAFRVRMARFDTLMIDPIVKLDLELVTRRQPRG